MSASQTALIGLAVVVLAIMVGSVNVIQANAYHTPWISPNRQDLYWYYHQMPDSWCIYTYCPYDPFYYRYGYQSYNPYTVITPNYHPSDLFQPDYFEHIVHKRVNVEVTTDIPNMALYLYDHAYFRHHLFFIQNGYTVTVPIYVENLNNQPVFIQVVGHQTGGAYNINIQAEQGFWLNAGENQVLTLIYQPFMYDSGIRLAFLGHP